MGKKKMAVIGDEEKVSEKKKVTRQEKPKTSKKETEKEAQDLAVEVENLEEDNASTREETASHQKKTSPKTGRSRNYKAALTKVDRNKAYFVEEGVALAQATSFSKFEGKIELHLTVREAGLSGEISFPHPAGRSARVAVATDELLAKVKDGQIDFDVLIASPEMMTKLAPLARILGPKGLMPNPKKGTISPEPEKVAAQMSGKTRFATEKKIPLIHLVVGSVKQSAEEVTANVKAVFSAIGPSNINKATLKATMGPGVKLTVES